MIWLDNNQKLVAIDPTIKIPKTYKKCINNCNHNSNCKTCKGYGVCFRCKNNNLKDWMKGRCINWWIMKNKHLKIVKLDCIHSIIETDSSKKDYESDFVKLNNGVNYII